MEKITHCINHNRFIPVDTEELTALELIGKGVEKTNELVDKSNNHEDRITENEKKKVSFDDMKNKYKFNNETDIDYRGKWFGLSEPTISDEGMRAQVQKNRDDILKHTEQLEDITNTELNINFFNGSTKEEKLINMIKFSMANGYKKVFVPSGEYDFSTTLTDTLLLWEDFKKIIIEGENPKTTIFKYSHLTNKPFIKVRGGSGQLCKGYISNITFIGNNTTTAIELNNICGYRVINCLFLDNKRGILMNNTENGFTEFNVAERCDFNEKCLTPLEYLKTGSQRSFHGSGLKECTINQGATNTTSLIIIGSGAIPYNAPLDFVVWVNNTTPIIQNNGDKNTNFYGNILVEPFNDDVMDICSGNIVWYLGNTNSHKETVKLGKLILCDRVQQNTDGTSSVIRKPYVKEFTLSNTIGDNDLLYLNDSETMLVDMRIYTNNYEFNYTLICNKFVGANQGKVTILATSREFDGATIGKPTFNIVDSNLRISCSGFVGKNVKIQAMVTQIGGKAQFFM